MNNEARRCLFCKIPKCSQACPVRTPIPAIMRMYSEGRVREAAKILFENNPFSAVTSQVCDWQQFCHGHCVLNIKKLAIRWYEIEQELSMAYIGNASLPENIVENGLEVSIVGGGPAGITAALMLRRHGYGVTIYDSKAEIGGVLRYGIPDFRLDKKYVDVYAAMLEKLGVKFLGKRTVGRDISLDSIRDRSDAVIVAAGAWVPRKLDIPGETENPDVIYALDYLQEPDKWKVGRNVLIVGGGNVTMDASRTAKRRGSDATVVYRKTFENMPAGFEEVTAAKEDGVEFMLFEVPVAIRREGTRNVAVLRRCENVHREDGRIATRMIEGSDHELDFDTMIVAISENVDYAILGGKPVESMPDVFLAGDYAYGPKTVVEAVASAKKVVSEILDYCPPSLEK